MTYLNDIVQKQLVGLYSLVARLIELQKDWQTFRQKKPRTAFTLQSSLLLCAAATVVLFLFLHNIRWAAFGQLPQKEKLNHISHYLASELYPQDSNRWERTLNVKETDLTNEPADKTGTCQNRSDGWLMVYNPQLVPNVLVGAGYPIVRFGNLRLGQDTNIALSIFTEFMLQVNEDSKFPKRTEAKFLVSCVEVQSMLNYSNIVWPKQNSTVQLDKAVAAVELPPEPTVILNG